MYSRRTVKRMVVVSLAVLLSVVFFGSCSAADKTLTEKNNGDNIRLSVNDTVEIKLESNPTTGYSWFSSDTVNDAIVSIKGPEFVESNEDKEMVGAGGYETFTIKAVSRGETDIILNYKRSWEEGIEPIDTFKITVSVE